MYPLIVRNRKEEMKRREGKERKGKVKKKGKGK